MIKGIDVGAVLAMAIASIATSALTKVKPHDTVERAVTIPKERRDELTKNLKPADKAKAEALFKRIADDTSDLGLLIASGGAVQPD